MSEYHESGWWLVEPPDSESEPPLYTDDPRYVSLEDWGNEWLYDWDEAAEEERRQLEFILENTSEFYDATAEHDLFKDVRVNDDGSFKVPERILLTPGHDAWAFSLHGRRHTFKERDDFGDIRFLGQGWDISGAIWVPHLYPFEEVDKRGLPLIKDRERSEITVVLSRIHGKEIYPNYVEIEFDDQIYGSQQSIEYIDSDAVFNEFVAIGKKLVAETVDYPEEKWPRLWNYVVERYPDNPQEEYEKIMLCKTPVPVEYSDQHHPLPWQTRKPSELNGQPFGSMWVAADDLRRGIDAKISFPAFNESPEQE